MTSTSTNFDPNSFNIDNFIPDNIEPYLSDEEKQQFAIHSDEYSQCILEAYEYVKNELGKKNKELNAKICREMRLKFDRAEWLNFNITEVSYKELIQKIDTKYSSTIDDIFGKMKTFLFRDNTQNTDKILRYEKLFHVLLVNFYNAQYKSLSLMVNRNANFYSMKMKGVSIRNKYILPGNRQIFSYTMITDILDCFKQLDLVDERKGYYDTEKKSGKLSRYLPKGEFLSIILQLISVVKQEIRPNVPIEYSDDSLKVKYPKEKGKKKSITMINMLDGAKFPSQYRSCRQKKEYIKQLKDEIIQINNFLKEHRIVINNPVNDYEKNFFVKSLVCRRSICQLSKDQYLMFPRCKEYERIFNNSCFTKGGRIYAPFQQFSSETRLKFTIDGQKVAGLDISNSHIRMLYHKIGVEYSGDAYEFMFDPKKHSERKCLFIRKMNKKILQTLINSDDINSATKSAFQTIREESKSSRYLSDFYTRFNKHGLAERWINRAKIKHAPIKQYFHTGIGRDLQFYESKLMLKTIFELMKLNIPSLCVHDELIIPESHIDITTDLLKKIYSDEICKGKELKLEVKKQLTE